MTLTLLAILTATLVLGWFQYRAAVQIKKLRDESSFSASRINNLYDKLVDSYASEQSAHARAAQLESDIHDLAHGLQPQRFAPKQPVKRAE